MKVTTSTFRRVLKNISNTARRKIKTPAGHIPPAIQDRWWPTCTATLLKVVFLSILTHRHLPRENCAWYTSAIRWHSLWNRLAEKHLMEQPAYSTWRFTN